MLGSSTHLLYVWVSIPPAYRRSPNGPSITSILQRFTGGWAALLQPEAILAVCGEIGYTGWRDRVLTPVTTVQLFLGAPRGPLPDRHAGLQDPRDPACDHAPRRGDLPCG